MTLAMSLDNILSIIGIVSEAVLVGLLVYRRLWQTLPVFGIYCAWALLSDAGAYAISHFSPTNYLAAYVAALSVDSALEFCVLTELTWSVLRPLRSSLSRVSLVVISAFVLGAGLAIWFFVSIPGVTVVSPQAHFMVRLQQTTSILRILFFLVLAGFSQLLSIGWRDREFQVVTGLGFFSVVSLAVEMLHTHQAFGPQYGHLNRVVIVSYIASLLYWVFSFAQQEAPRREFTPQMQNFLLAVAGVARANRVAMTSSSVDELHGRRKP